MKETFRQKLIMNRHNRFDVLYSTITRRTNGNIVFREQMESALSSLGGFSIRHVSVIMKAILNKENNLVMAYYPLFRANLLGIYPDKDVENLWNSIVLSPALVEMGALCNHLAHGEGYSSDCGVCFGIKNKFPVHPTASLSDGPGTVEQKTRYIKIDVALGLLERILADSESKGEPLSAAAKDFLTKTYIIPRELIKNFCELSQEICHTSVKKEVEPIKDYDLHHTNDDRLMRMRTDIKPLKEAKITEAQPEIEVCKCNIWVVGCTCGVMERERARKS